MSKGDNDSGRAAAAIQRLLRLDACAVSDALDKLKLNGVVSGLERLSGADRIAGRVVTMKLGTGTPPPGPVRHLGTTAVQAAGPGDVIVIEQRSGVEAGSWGGILTLGAKLRGVAGVVADGPVRDIDEARSQDFPVFARACTARTARGRIVELGTNCPVTIGKVTVRPGDYVVADGSGVVFVPAENIDAVLDAAETIAAREAAMAKALLAGKPITEVMGANYEDMLKTGARH
jgi:4-hydroxy-4-methyl-2-oxoglutarate aldolase